MTDAPLSKFEGLPVTEVGAEVPSLAGGLQRAFAVEPREDHHGDEVFMLIKARTTKVRHEPINKKDVDGDQRRVHVYTPETVVFVPRAFAAEQIDEQERLIAEHEDEQQRLKELQKIADRNQVTLDEAIVIQAHEDGEHVELVDGCAKCEEESRLEDMGL